MDGSLKSGALSAPEIDAILADYPLSGTPSGVSASMRYKKEDIGQYGKVIQNEDPNLAEAMEFVGLV